MTTLTEYRSTSELLGNLTLRELRSKYKRSALGWAWSLLNPLATLLIFSLVFRFFMRVQLPPSETSGLQNYALFLSCGLLPWNYFTNSVSGSIGTLVGNANLIKKTYFPRELLVFSNVASWNVSLLIEMGILLLVFLAFGNMVLPWIPALLVLIVLLTLFVAGLSLIFSVLNVFFRDVQHLVGIVFQAWLYLTPVIYPITLIPESHVLFGVDLPLRRIWELNPMARFVGAFRDVLYDLRWPELNDIGYLALVSVATFFIGLTVFNRLSGRLAEEL